VIGRTCVARAFQQVLVFSWKIPFARAFVQKLSVGQIAGPKLAIPSAVVMAAFLKPKDSPNPKRGAGLIP
jgi:uncharacterized membrane protein YraQ (UPF0718 family)